MGRRAHFEIIAQSHNIAYSRPRDDTAPQRAGKKESEMTTAENEKDAFAESVKTSMTPEEVVDVVMGRLMKQSSEGMTEIFCDLFGSHDERKPKRDVNEEIKEIEGQCAMIDELLVYAQRRCTDREVVARIEAVAEGIGMLKPLLEQLKVSVAA